MTVESRPASVCFAADMSDYVIDSDSSIAFEIQYAGKAILSETYVPDADYKIRVRKLGRFCRMALWGNFATGLQSSVMGVFTFLINGTQDAQISVIYSDFITRASASATRILSSAREKVTVPGAIEYLSFYLPSASSVSVVAVDNAGVQHTSSLYSGSGVVTLDVSYNTISALFTGVTISDYTVSAGAESFEFIVDTNSYVSVSVFRFKNKYDLPECMHTVGDIKLKGNDDTTTGFMWGVERKFNSKCTDEYTVNSGIIFSQSAYKTWHDLLNSRQVEVFVSGTWYPIIISKQSYERTMRKSALKAVEFTFRMADMDHNGVIDV